MQNLKKDEKTIHELLKDRWEITHIKEIEKGWSPDKKYYIETNNNGSLFLRISDIKELKRKEMEFEMLRIAATTGVVINRPIEFKIINEGKQVYQLTTWVEGTDLHEAITNMTSDDRQKIGYKAGELLRKLHSIPAPKKITPWIEIFRKKIDDRVESLKKDNIASENLSILINHLYENIHLLNNRTQCFNHGDFGIYNLMLLPDGQLGVIDFNAFTSIYGDPYWEFCSIPYGNEADESYYSGLFNGYFNDTIPNDFFPLLAFYFAYDGLASLCEMTNLDKSAIADCWRHVDNILSWFDNMKNPIPSWYTGHGVL